MSDRICASYEALGLTPEDASQIAALVAAPPAGLIEPDEHANIGEVSGAQLALLGAIVAASQGVTFAAALPLLLGSVAAHVEELSPYDVGRFFHIKGHTTWQLEQSLYTALHALNQSIANLQESDHPHAEAYLGRAHNSYGQLLQQKGLLFDALKEFEEALRLLEAEGDEADLAHVLGSLGRLSLDFGAYQAAATYLSRDLDIVRRTSPGMTRLQTQLLSHLGRCAVELGHYDEAEARYDESLAMAREGDDVVGQAFALLGCAQIHLRQGDAAGAREEADLVEVLLQENELPPQLDQMLQGLRLRLRADIYQQQDDTSAAIADFKSARTHLQSADFVSPVEHADLLQGYARALFDTGDNQGGARLLREALTHLDSTAAERLRERMEEELQTRSPDSWLLHSAGRFVGQRHIEFLLKQTGLGGFRGERKSVCVMFADIRGFSQISQQMTPQKLIGFLNDFLGQMTRCVEICGGFVDKFIGDAIMAVFSLPEPQADDADRALQAALLMQAELARFCRRRVGEIPPLAIGTGLHRGEVVAGLIGSPQKRSYTVIGDAVNTSSRLEGMTKQLGAPLLISRSMYDQLHEPSQYLIRPIGHFVPKGQSNPVEVFDVLGEEDGTAFSKAMRAEIARSNLANELFLARDFGAAIDAFGALATETHDQPRALSYQRLRAAAEMMATQGVPDDWAGAISLDSK